MVDSNKDRVDRINQAGVAILSQGSTLLFHPQAVQDSEPVGTVDLVLVFVKAQDSRSALATNRHLIGESTYVMTLQNGAGHEAVLSDFVPTDRLILGTTEHNSSVTPGGEIHHGGGGKTYIGLLTGNSGRLPDVALAFSSCGLETVVVSNIEERIWRKVFMNASASVMTGVLGVKLGFILDNEYAWRIAKQLLTEAVMVANAEGMDFDLDEIVGNVRDLLGRVYHGYTSIYADLQSGRRTEVDTINGTIVRKAKALGVQVPTHELVVDLIHALEGKQSF